MLMHILAVMTNNAYKASNKDASSESPVSSVELTYSLTNQKNDIIQKQSKPNQPQRYLQVSVKDKGIGLKPESLLILQNLLLSENSHKGIEK